MKDSDGDLRELLAAVNEPGFPEPSFYRDCHYDFWTACKERLPAILDALQNAQSERNTALKERDRLRDAIMEANGLLHDWWHAPASGRVMSGTTIRDAGQILLRALSKGE